MIAVKYDDLSMAFNFVSAAVPMEIGAYVSLETGEVYLSPDNYDLIGTENPVDLDMPDRYLPIPHKNELGLGRSLALRFIAQALPACYEQVEEFFRRKGAYGRFKDLLARKGMLEVWHAFEAEATDKALRQWCADNGLEVRDS
ncbi:hypothetical protein L602_000100001940 [Cupriavidus gilardii J11]|uniref:Uncharacterized protein n=1 Tax=Cupriavidus gilardii J11 TaxID=936133 RepID=A0A562BVP5_9BURK|nr:hypothetical protein [Cupriavidus gilardii]TWG89304.1 hypothetical protein L602_000100001940 [Cupriavidus gilardii J11]